MKYRGSRPRALSTLSLSRVDVTVRFNHRAEGPIDPSPLSRPTTAMSRLTGGRVGRRWPAQEAQVMVRTTISATEADGLCGRHLLVPAVEREGAFIRTRWMPRPSGRLESV
jgi:hypothetical protein